MFAIGGVEEDARYWARWMTAGLMSMPVVWKLGKRVAREVEIVPGPQPTSRSVKVVLWFACESAWRVGRRCPALFWAVRDSMWIWTAEAC